MARTTVTAVRQTWDLYEIGGRLGYYVGHAKQLSTGGWARRVDAHRCGRGSRGARNLLAMGAPSRCLGTICADRAYAILAEQRAWVVRKAAGWLSVHPKPILGAEPPSGMAGKTHSPETRAKMSAAHHGKHRSREHCRRISQGQLGHPGWNKGKVTPAEVRAKIAAAKRGKPRSAATKRKLRRAMRGRTPWNKGRRGIYSETTLANWSALRRGRAPWNKGIRSRS